MQGHTYNKEYMAHRQTTHHGLLKTIKGSLLKVEYHPGHFLGHSIDSKQNFSVF